MKKILMTLLVLMTLSASLNAQWYLFPGKKASRTPDTVAVAAVADTVAARPAPVYVSDTLAVLSDTLVAALPDSLAVLPDSLAAPEFVLDIPEVIGVSLLLPLKSTTENPSANFLEYYSGALMAVRDLGESGLRINLNVYDTADRRSAPSDEQLQISDVIIGPVGRADIEALLPRCPEGKFIVSPLEPGAAALADSGRVVQVPAPWTAQIDEMVRWLAEDTGFLDKVLVLTEEKPAQNSAQSDYLRERLVQEGLACQYLFADEFTGLDILGKTRVIVDSQDDMFLCKTINNLARISENGGNVVLYSTSKVRSLEGISSTSLYLCNTRMTANYYIDYSSPEVKEFILDYRSLFAAEPSSFAFQGYDLMHYFVSLCSTWGRQWQMKLPEFRQEGLQSDFIFEQSDKTGSVNTATRRIIYSPDLSTTLQ